MAGFGVAAYRLIKKVIRLGRRKCEPGGAYF